jgi:hypothetical protein
MVIPLGRPSLAGSSDLPGSLAHRAGTHAEAFLQGLRNGLRLFRPRVRLERADSRRSLTGDVSAFPPYLVLLRVGFAMPRTLLPRRCALTAPFHPYLNSRSRRYLLCGTFRLTRLNAPSRTLSGTLLCGVRTFLSLPVQPRETLSFTEGQRPSGPASAISYYKMKRGYRLGAKSFVFWNFPANRCAIQCAMMSRFIVLAVMAVNLSVPSKSSNLDYRPPTAREQRALDNFSKVIDKVLAQFRDDDWAENVDHSLTGAEVNPNSEVPLEVNSIIQRSYDVRRNSDRYQEKILPLVKQMVESTDFQEKKDINDQVQDLMHVQVQIRLNRRTVAIDPPPPDNEDLRIAGTALAYKIRREAFPSGSAYTLFCGDAKSLVWDGEHNWFQFKFNHPANTPVIENVEIRIYGAEDRIQHLLQTIDWKLVNAALISEAGGQKNWDWD